MPVILGVLPTTLNGTNKHIDMILDTASQSEIQKKVHPVELHISLKAHHQCDCKNNTQRMGKNINT